MFITIVLFSALIALSAGLMGKRYFKRDFEIQDLLNLFTFICSTVSLVYFMLYQLIITYAIARSLGQTDFPI